MNRGRRALLLGVTVLVAAGAGVVAAMRSNTLGDSSPRARARALYLQALDAQVRLDGAEVRRLLRASWRADSSYWPAVLEVQIYFGDTWSTRAVLHDFEALADRQDDSVRADCIRTIAETTKMGTWRITSASPRPSDDCGLFIYLYSERHLEREEKADGWRQLARRYPEQWTFLHYAVINLPIGDAQDEHTALVTQMMRRDRHPLIRARGYAWRAIGLHTLGRHDEAFAVEAEAEEFTKDPGARLRYLELLRGTHGGLPIDPLVKDAILRHVDSVMEQSQRETLNIADAADLATRVRLRLRWAEQLMHQGRLRESAREWDDLIALADSLALERFQVHVYARRGRVHVKLGDADAAERDLLAARDFGARTGFTTWALEAEHELLHLYEATGRYELAKEAGAAFVRYARLEGMSARRMMSRHDVAWLLRRLGDREGARRHFEAVVAYVDSTDDAHAFAGEYFELIGDLDRAATYYHRVISLPGSPDRAAAGLARIAEATGDVETAIEYARLQDRQFWVTHPESVPILPGVLARAGRVAEAIAELERARDVASERGQAAGWAQLSLELAELELEDGAVHRAAALADSAAHEAARVAPTEIAIRAQALAALARTYSGDDSRAEHVARLRDVRHQAEVTGLPKLEADVALMYGDALVVAGEIDAAFDAFRYAADRMDSIATSLANDPTRAGFRATQRRVSDRALAAIVARHEDRRAPAWFAEWSIRRKSRGILEEVTSSTARPWRDAARILAHLPSGIGTDMAVVDYAVLDTAVAALVLTDRGAQIVLLPVSADTLTERIQRLHASIAPRVGSFVDRSRARFDTGIARQLFAELLTPLEPALGGRTRLTLIADGPLHLVPFDALVVSRSDSAVTYALDRYTITVATSLGANIARDGGIMDGPIVAAFGPETSGILVGTAEEAAGIATAVTDRETVLLRGDAATERAIREHASRAAVLHFAAHARTNDHDPDFARIALAAGGEDDGLLHAYEVRGWDLTGTLVVLSACETSAGRAAGGEGLLSLSRAFLQAGAGGVVGTLWPVSEAAGDLMEVFYHQLDAGAATSDALRSAKIALRRGAYSDPLYWAPFTVVTRTQ